MENICTNDVRSFQTSNYFYLLTQDFNLVVGTSGTCPAFLAGTCAGITLILVCKL